MESDMIPAWHDAILEVREEGSIAGVVHQVGNYPDSDLWRKYGTTDGSA
jgi:hypothetical protein